VAASVVGGILLVGCQSDKALPPLERVNSQVDNASMVGAAQGRSLKTLDDQYADLGGEIPGFGGMYHERDGTLTVLLTNPQSYDAARARIASFMSRGMRPTQENLDRVSGAVTRSVAKQARHEFRSLLAWSRTHVEPAVLGMDGVILTAIDHANNRIVVGVESADRMALTRETVDRLPIPRSSYGVVLIGQIRETADTNLYDAFRPVVPAGVRIERSLSQQLHQCSLGFNFVRWIDATTMDESRFFATAGHCSPTHGVLENTTHFGQPAHSDGVGGLEVIDPHWFIKAQNPQCPDSRRCWYADAALYRYNGSEYAEQGKVAWTTSLGSWVVSGRMTITSTASPTQNQLIYMVGPSSGRQVGYVSYPCANIKFPAPSDKAYVCVGVADYFNLDGDSGSPVVEGFGDGTAWAVGINFARGETSFPGNPTYSFFGHIHSVLNTFYETAGYNLDPTTNTVLAPIPPSSPAFSAYYATISGTTTMGTSMTCHWYGGTTIENPSYQWIVNGTVIGTSSDVYYTSGSSSFTLELHVTDSGTGAFAYKSLDITVSQGTPQCYDQ
jgi:hypothetical protein